MPRDFTASPRPASAAMPEPAHGPQLIAVAGKPGRAPRVGQRIEHRIAGRVVRLARANRARSPPTKTARRNRAAASRVATCRFHAPCDLRQHRPIELFERHLGQDAIGQHAGRMNDAAQRRASGGICCERRCERLGVRHIALQRDDLARPCRESRRAVASTSADGARRDSSAIVPGPLLRQPLGHAQAERTQARR